MAISNFIPTLWSAAILENFRQAQAVIPTLNRQFEGEVAAGNTVKITSITTPSIQDYSASRTLTIDALSDSTQSLVIDQEKAFSFKVDDVDRVQAAGSFEPVTADAGRALAEDAESFVLELMKADGSLVGDTAIDTAAKAFDAIVAMRKELGKNKVPASQRYLVVNPEFAALLLSEGSKLTTADAAGSTGELRNGVLGGLLGFTVIEHPLLVNGGAPAAIAYHGPSVAYVGQIAKTEAGRMELAFADYVRALNVYGAKTLRGEAIATWIVD